MFLKKCAASASAKTGKSKDKPATGITQPPKPAAPQAKPTVGMPGTGRITPPNMTGPVIKKQGPSLGGPLQKSLRSNKRGLQTKVLTPSKRGSLIAPPLGIGGGPAAGRTDTDGKDQEGTMAQGKPGPDKEADKGKLLEHVLKEGKAGVEELTKGDSRTAEGSMELLGTVVAEGPDAVKSLTENGAKAAEGAAALLEDILKKDPAGLEKLAAKGGRSAEGITVLWNLLSQKGAFKGDSSPSNPMGSLTGNIGSGGIGTVGFGQSHKGFRPNMLGMLGSGITTAGFGASAGIQGTIGPGMLNPGPTRLNAFGKNMALAGFGNKMGMGNAAKWSQLAFGGKDMDPSKFQDMNKNAELKQAMGMAAIPIDPSVVERILEFIETYGPPLVAGIGAFLAGVFAVEKIETVLEKPQLPISYFALDENGNIRDVIPALEEGAGKGEDEGTSGAETYDGLYAGATAGLFNQAKEENSGEATGGVEQTEGSEKSDGGESETVEQPTNTDKVNDNYLKKNGIDAHKVKEEARGTAKDGSKYDLYVDKDTGELWVYRKGGKGEGIPTGEYIK